MAEVRSDLFDLLLRGRVLGGCVCWLWFDVRFEVLVLVVRSMEGGFVSVDVDSSRKIADITIVVSLFDMSCM